MFSRFVALVIFAVGIVHAQTVYLAGDSTMAKGSASSGIDGWGNHLQQYLSIPVVNNAIGGRSSRSFTEEGRFTAIVNLLKAGDFVVIEFGHNDGSAGAVDNGRQCAVGDGYDTTAVVTTSTGAQITIHSFPYYMQNAITSIKAKGAIPIVSSLVPWNDWVNGVNPGGSRFVDYCTPISTRTGATYVNHNKVTVKAYNTLGQSAIAAFFPGDHTHTNAAGANFNAQTFVRGVLCGSSTLKNYVNAAGKAVPNYGCS